MSVVPCHRCRSHLLRVGARTLLVVALTAPAFAQDARSVIAAASSTMGVDGLSSITLTGSAAEGNFGQSRTISFGLASTSIRNYSRTIDFTAPASHAVGDAVRPVPRGTAPPLATPWEERITSATPEWSRQLQIWVTPWAFLKGAAASGTATVRSRKVSNVPYQVVTWVPAQKAPSGKPYRLVGWVSPQNVVDRVETWVEHPLMGDLHVETTYADFRDVSGVKVPVRISQRLAGMETFVVAINQARVNPPDLAELMQGELPPPPPPLAPIASERLADGVYRLAGDYVSLVVEFKDHVAVLEAGQNEARGLAVIAETKRLFPTKKIKYVVSSHPHFDHAGGLPPFVAEGATIIADDNSKFWVGASMSEPRTLVGDVLAKSGKKPKVEGVIDTLVLKDDTHTLELYHVDDLEHSDAMLIAFLPKERILFTADFNPPRQGQAPSPSLATLIENLERLKLDFDRHITVHPVASDRPLTKADLHEWVKVSGSGR